MHSPKKGYKDRTRCAAWQQVSPELRRRCTVSLFSRRTDGLGSAVPNRKERAYFPLISTRKPHKTYDTVFCPGGALPSTPACPRYVTPLSRAMQSYR